MHDVDAVVDRLLADLAAHDVDDQRLSFDIALPAVAQLVAFLDADPRWQRAERTEKWAAWRRLSSGPLWEDWTSQPFLARPAPRTRRLFAALKRRLLSVAR